MVKNIDVLFEKAGTLIEALPYIQRFFGKTVVIKYGGNAMMNEDLTQKILQDITLLKFIGMNPIVVHGGGPDINALLKLMKIQPTFHNGLRVTDEATMGAVQMVLTGKINVDLVAKLNALGGKAIGLNGKDAKLIEVEKLPPQDGVDLGFVGRITKINTKLLNLLTGDEYIPVIAPIGCGPEGESYNINADTAAGAVAAALKAEKLIFLTDIDGIRADPKDPDTLIYHIGVAEVLKLLEDGAIDGGMIPKVRGCIDAIEHGVNRTHILNGTIPHPILLEIFTDSGIGTMVTGEWPKKDKYA
ncbi:MAG: acetylglutamate kinase [Christensenellales bacterium]|jgi:acetylglutamate kinase